jgi:hypothetical protein
MIGKFKRTIRNYYDTRIAFSKIGNLFYLLENRNKTKPCNDDYTEYSITGKIINIDFLIATQSKGLLLYSNGKIVKLFNQKGFYGITKNSNRFFTFHKTGMHGNIISFKIQNNRAYDVKIVIKGFSRGIHQIDFIDADLYVTNTYDNSILIYKNASSIQNLHWKKYDKIIYPNKKLNRGRKSSNYNHFNSIFRYQDKIYLIAHNETKKTKRASEVYSLDITDHSTLKLEKTKGSNCHNIYINNTEKMYCNSLKGTLNINGENIISHKNIFTRGLSISDKYLILGGSDLQPNRLKRDKTNGYIYIYDSQRSLKQTILIQNTQIQEINMLDNERTLSNFIENKANL